MKIDWFEMWHDDKVGMINTMLRNLRADLDVGYDPRGKAVQDQLAMIESYKKDFDAAMDKIAEMEPARVQHYCYIQLKKAGAI